MNLRRVGLFRLQLWRNASEIHQNDKMGEDYSLGGGFKYFLCSPIFGEDFQFDQLTCLKWVETTNQLVSTNTPNIFWIDCKMPKRVETHKVFKSRPSLNLIPSRIVGLAPDRFNMQTNQNERWSKAISLKRPLSGSRFTWTGVSGIFGVQSSNTTIATSRLIGSNLISGNI